MPYLARSALAEEAESGERRDWRSPASSPYFSVVSSTEGVLVEGSSALGTVLSSSVVLKMWRAELDGVWRWILIWVAESWKEREPSRMARTTMRDFVNRKIRERIMVKVD